MNAKPRERAARQRPRSSGNFGVGYTSCIRHFWQIL
jgi:hypothetical protein